jgi:hypothetical protein
MPLEEEGLNESPSNRDPYSNERTIMNALRFQFLTSAALASLMMSGAVHANGVDAATRSEGDARNQIETEHRLMGRATAVAGSAATLRGMTIGSVHSATVTDAHLQGESVSLSAHGEAGLAARSDVTADGSAARNPSAAESDTESNAAAESTAGAGAVVTVDADGAPVRHVVESGKDSAQQQVHGAISAVTAARSNAEALVNSAEARTEESAARARARGEAVTDSVGSAVAGTLGATLEAELRQSIAAGVSQEISHAASAAVAADVAHVVKAQVAEEVSGSVQAAVTQEVSQAVAAEIGEQIRDVVKGDVAREIREAVNAEVAQHVEGALRDAGL